MTKTDTEKNVGRELPVTKWPETLPPFEYVWESAEPLDKESEATHWEIWNTLNQEQWEAFEKWWAEEAYRGSAWVSLPVPQGDGSTVADEHVRFVKHYHRTRDPDDPTLRELKLTVETREDCDREAARQHWMGLKAAVPKAKQELKEMKQKAKSAKGDEAQQLAAAIAALPAMIKEMQAAIKPAEKKYKAAKKITDAKYAAK